MVDKRPGWYDCGFMLPTGAFVSAYGDLSKNLFHKLREHDVEVNRHGEGALMERKPAPYGTRMLDGCTTVAMAAGKSLGWAGGMSVFQLLSLGAMFDALDSGGRVMIRPTEDGQVELMVNMSGPAAVATGICVEHDRLLPVLGGIAVLYKGSIEMEWAL